MLHSQFELKEKMLHAVLPYLKNEDLTVISFTDNIKKIYWEEEGDEKEFSFNGEMYDLVRTDTINGHVYLYCFNDKEEQHLIDLYNSITKSNSAAGKKGKSNSFISVTLFIAEAVNYGNLFSFKTINKYKSFCPLLSSGVTNDTSPPPKA